MNKMEYGDGKYETKKSTVFPHTEDYERDPIIKERRERLLKIISILAEAGREVDGAEEKGLTLQSASQEVRLAELIALVEPLKSIKEANREYLEQFMEEGKLLPGKSFNEKARKNPEIMTAWIAHDIISIMDRLPNAKTPLDFLATLGSLGFFQNVLDAEFS